MVQRIRGTNRSDDINGTTEDDIIFGLAGNDTLNGGSGNDRIFGGRGNDTIELSSGRDSYFGGQGNDTYLLNPAFGSGSFSITERKGEGFDSVIINTPLVSYTNGPNIERVVINSSVQYLSGSNQSERFDASSQSQHMAVFGGGGNDTILGTSDHDRIDGGTGVDRMIGGDGFDRYFVDRAADVVVEKVSDGDFDTVIASVNYTIDRGVENLSLTGKARVGNGSSRDDFLGGSNINNVLNGRRGNDTLVGNEGNDSLVGAAGSDLLDGGEGRDTMVGGIGQDVFTFVSFRDSGRTNASADLIRGLERRDTIDLTAIDADVSTAGAQAFDFIRAAGFSGDGGELRFAGGSLIADRNGDGRGDFFIKVAAGSLQVVEDTLLL